MERYTQTHTHKCTRRECRHTPSKIRLTTEVELTNNYSNPLPVTANREMNIVSVISVALSVWMCSVFIMGSFTDRGEESLNTHTSPFSHSISTWTAHPGQKVDSTVATISRGRAEEQVLFQALSTNTAVPTAGGSASSSTHKQIFRSLKTVDLENSFQGEDFQETLLFWCAQETVFSACSFCLTSSFVCKICLCKLIFKNNSDKWPTQPK